MIKIDLKIDEGLDEQLTIQMDDNICSFFFKFLIQIICRLNIMCIAIFNNFLTVYLFILYLNFICKTISLDFDLCENFISKERKNSS